MDTYSDICCVLLLVLSGGSLLVNSQNFPAGYARRGMFSTGMYRRGMPPYGGFNRPFSQGISAQWTEGSVLYPPGYSDPSLDGSVLHPNGIRDPMPPIATGIDPIGPVVPMIPGGGRPNVVSDNSGRSSLNLNIQNENNNIHNQAGSGVVTVRQERTSHSGTGTSCRIPCQPMMGSCYYPSMCVPNPACLSGFGCQ